MKLYNTFTLFVVSTAATLLLISTMVSALPPPLINDTSAGFTTDPLQNRTCSAKITPSKSGMCPPEDPYLNCFWCNDNCRADTECPEDKKCCPQSGCGNSCKDPVASTILKKN